MLFPVNQIIMYVMSASLISDDVNLSNLVKGMTASVLHYQVTIFPFVLNKHLFWEKYREIMHISCFSLKPSPINLRTSQWILPAAIIAVCAYGECLLPSLLPQLLVGILLQEIVVPWLGGIAGWIFTPYTKRLQI